MALVLGIVAAGCGTEAANPPPEGGKQKGVIPGGGEGGPDVKAQQPL